MVKYVKVPNILINDPEGDVGVESDIEDDSLGIRDGPPEKGQTRAVLAIGSFSACVHFSPS